MKSLLRHCTPRKDASQSLCERSEANCKLKSLLRRYAPRKDVSQSLCEQSEANCKMKKCYVYFMTNKNNTVIYCGVTSHLIKRVYQHKAKFFKGFTAKYNCDKLVYFESYDTIKQAIAREKQIKAGNRKRKEELINRENSDWNDLSEGWIFTFN